MNHVDERAFTECIYLHYSERLRDPKLPQAIRDDFHHRQLKLADRYCMTFWSLHETIIDNILKKIKMHNPQFPDICTPLHTDAILQMAAIIERRIQHGEKCKIHSNSHRIALKDQNDVVICWIRLSK